MLMWNIVYSKFSQKYPKIGVSNEKSKTILVRSLYTFSTLWYIYVRQPNLRDPMYVIIIVQYTSSCENNVFINWLLNIERHRWLIASRHLSRKNAHSCGMIEPNHLPSEVMRKNSLFKELTFRHDYWPKNDDSVVPLPSFSTGHCMVGLLR